MQKTSPPHTHTPYHTTPHHTPLYPFPKVPSTPYHMPTTLHHTPTPTRYSIQSHPINLTHPTPLPHSIHPPHPTLLPHPTTCTSRLKVQHLVARILFYDVRLCASPKLYFLLFNNYNLRNMLNVILQFLLDSNKEMQREGRLSKRSARQTSKGTFRRWPR